MIKLLLPFLLWEVGEHNLVQVKEFMGHSLGIESHEALLSTSSDYQS